MNEKIMYLIVICILLQFLALLCNLKIYILSIIHKITIIVLSLTFFAKGPHIAIYCNLWLVAL